MGTSKACGQAGNGGVLGRSGCMRNLNLGSEDCAVSPYSVQDHADAPGKGDIAMEDATEQSVKANEGEEAERVA